MQILVHQELEAKVMLEVMVKEVADHKEFILVVVAAAQVEQDKLL